MARATARLAAADLAALDRLVRSAGFASRAAALRAGLARLLSLATDREVAAAYRRVYGREAGAPDEWGAAVAEALAAVLGPPAAAAPAPPRQVVTDPDGMMWDLTPREGEPVPPEVMRKLRRPIGIDLAEVERRRRRREEGG